MSVGQQTYDDRKFKELLLYVAQRCVSDRHFGKTKLNKILYFVDFEAYGRLGRSVTGAEYQRRPYGPVPREILGARQDLVLAGAAHVETAHRFGYAQGRLVAEQSADTSVFTADELELIEEVIDSLWHLTGAAVSEMSHQELGWQLAEDGDTIPYHTVFLDHGPLTDDDIRRGQELYRIYGSSAGRGGQQPNAAISD